YSPNYTAKCSAPIDPVRYTKAKLGHPVLSASRAKTFGCGKAVRPTPAFDSCTTSCTEEECSGGQRRETPTPTCNDCFNAFQPSCPSYGDNGSKGTEGYDRLGTGVNEVWSSGGREYGSIVHYQRKECKYWTDTSGSEPLRHCTDSANALLFRSSRSCAICIESLCTISCKRSTISSRATSNGPPSHRLYTWGCAKPLRTAAKCATAEKWHSRSALFVIFVRFSFFLMIHTVHYVKL
ncbi:hypothetical protein OESDEN_01868, partial [Oesophagostomum dentatum]